MPLLGAFAPPFHRFLIIPGNTPAILIYGPKEAIGQATPLPGRLAIQIQSFFIILGYTPAQLILVPRVAWASACPCSARFLNIVKALG